MHARWLIFFVMQTFPATAQLNPSFESLRYNEDYAVLKSDTTRNWYSRLKYSPLGSSAHISVGGAMRYQYFHIRNENWGDAKADKDGFILSRGLLHADIHRNHFRAFVQLQSSMANGKLSTSPIEENPLDIHQCFADANVIKLPDLNWLIRVGRQEFSYGSQRLVSVRELPNNRQSFDGIKSVLNYKNCQLDLLYSYHVTSSKGIIDDVFKDDNRLWGAYLLRKNKGIINNMDIYYLGVSKTYSVFDDSRGKEERHSLGSRIWLDNKLFGYDIEAVFQWGRHSRNVIRAWTVSSNIFCTYNTKESLLGIKSELIGGDRRYDDGVLNTFNPLYPRGAYFGVAALIGPSNLIDVHPYIEIILSQNFKWQCDYDIFWRMQTADGIYGPNVQLIYSGRHATSKDIGRQLGTSFQYKPNTFLSFTLAVTWFSAGTYLKQVGAGKDIGMANTTMQIVF